MSRDASITIVIPAHDEEHQLERAVSDAVAAAAAWFDDCDVLVFDDGSTDGTLRVAEHLAGRFDCVSVFHRETPQGAGAAIRAGYARADTDYVIWLDGKGSVPRASIEKIFSHLGEAELIVPHPANQHERSRLRRVISRGIVGLLNLRFGLDLTYYTHHVLVPTALANRFPVSADTTAYQAEALVTMIRSGHSYHEIDVADRYVFENRRGSAFSLRNLLGVAHFLYRALLGFPDSTAERARCDAQVSSWQARAGSRL